MVTMICMFPLNFSNLRDEDIYKIVTNLFYWGVFCIYGISAGDSTENFPRFGPSVVSMNSVFVPLHSLWRWDWTFIYIASDTGMMFSVVSFSTQGEMNLPAYLHPVAIKPYFNEKMNIWTLHFSQQCSISGSCAFYSLWLKQLQWQQPGSSPSVQLFHRRQNGIDVSKDRPVLFWVLSFSWDHANKPKKKPHSYLSPLWAKALFQEYKLFLPTCFFKFTLFLFYFYLPFLSEFCHTI